MPKYNLPPSVDAFRGVHLEGNITPDEWRHRLVKLKRGKPYPYDVAINLLSEFTYWYRPVVVKDEKTGLKIGYRKKFSGLLLQRDYPQIRAKFGYSEKQSREALQYLEELHLAYRCLVTIRPPGKPPSSNVLHIHLVSENVLRLTRLEELLTFDKPPEYPNSGDMSWPFFNNLEGGAPSLQGTTLLPYREPPSFPIGNHPPSLQGTTYTETTYKTSNREVTPLNPPKGGGGDLFTLPESVSSDGVEASPEKEKKVARKKRKVEPWKPPTKEKITELFIKKIKAYQAEGYEVVGDVELWAAHLTFLYFQHYEDEDVNWKIKGGGKMKSPSKSVGYWVLSRFTGKHGNQFRTPPPNQKNPDNGTHDHQPSGLERRMEKAGRAAQRAIDRLAQSSQPRT